MKQLRDFEAAHKSFKRRSRKVKILHVMYRNITERNWDQIYSIWTGKFQHFLYCLSLQNTYFHWILHLLRKHGTSYSYIFMTTFNSNGGTHKKVRNNIALKLGNFQHFVSEFCSKEIDLCFPPVIDKVGLVQGVFNIHWTEWYLVIQNNISQLKIEKYYCDKN